MLENVKTYIRHFLDLMQTNLCKTLYFNFKMLPWKEALRCPILLYGPIKLYQCTGSINWSSKMKCHFGSWRIGDQYLANNGLHPNTTLISIQGNLVLGERGRINNGTRFEVGQNATMTLGNNFFINYNSILLSYCRISIDDNFLGSWDVQIMDTNCHYIATSEGEVYNIKAPIKLGKNCWVGNRVTILKGSKIADNVVVAGNSLINKDYSNSSQCMLAGIPAKVVRTKVHRLEEQYFEIVKKHFLENPESKSCNI